MTDLTSEIDAYHQDQRATAHMYLLTVAAKAVAATDAIAAAEDKSGVLSDGGPLVGMYQKSGARVMKRSRKGKSRHISLRIMVDDEGTSLFWPSLMGLRKKKFNLSTLFEVVEMDGENKIKQETGCGEISIVRLRNNDRWLDFVIQNPLDCAFYVNFFNGFRR